MNKTSKSDFKGLINTLSKAGVLKDVKRTGWVLKGVTDVESVADHTWRMSLLIMLLAEKALNKQKLLEMNTVHDLGEIGVGDIKWETGKKVIADQRAKHEDELKSVEEIFGNQENGDYYISLLQEFNEQKTPEAKFLKQVDKLEMVLQALEYERQGYPGHLFDEFWENAEKYIAGNSLEPVFKYLQELKKEEESK